MLSCLLKVERTPSIKILWVNFTNQQKLIASFIIKEIITSDNSHKQIHSESFYKELNIVLEECIGKMPPYNEVLKPALLSLAKKESSYLDQNTSFINYKMLKEFINTPELTSLLPTISDLLQKIY